MLKGEQVNNKRFSRNRKEQQDSQVQKPLVPVRQQRENIKTYEPYIQLCYPSASYNFIKRLVDVIFSLLGLVLFAPLMLIIVCVIKLDSSGPVLFRQIRIGKNRRSNLNRNGHLYERRNGNLKGKPFNIYKFRTMRNDVECYAISPSNNSDARLTSVGKIIRPLCLDELPQLFNVLKGDLSLVGPRPEMSFIVQDYNQIEELRLTVKPGITGLWQLYGSRTQHIHENLKYDLAYIKKCSLMLDFKIMIKTISFMFNFKNI